MTLADWWKGFLLMGAGSSVRRRRAVRAVTFGCPTTTWAAGAGVILALTGRCHPPVFVAESGFKLEVKTISPNPKKRI